MNDLNKVILIGNLVRDPESRYLASGTALCQFSVAVNKEWMKDGEKKKETAFINVTAWAKLGEVIMQYCRKGNKIMVEGRLKQDAWEDSDGKKKTALSVTAENVQFLTPKSSSDAVEKEFSKPDEQPSFDSLPENPFSDDLPF